MNKKKLLSLLMLTVFVSPLAACSGDGGKSTTLRVLNMEDYIYVNDPDNGYDEDDLTDQFEQYIADDPVLSEKFGKVNVIYDTTDTNETLYSEMQTGKAHYDLICTSDYMIQKLVMYDLIEELDWDEVTNDVAIPTYHEYGSDYIRGRLNDIKATRFKDQQELSLQKFAVGYMWGTLGILFNPDYKKFDSISETLYDMQDWATLWDSKYEGTISVKDSMRDTYAVGIMYTYQDELKKLLEEYKTTGDRVKYNEDLTEIFNRCEKEQVEEVKKSLMDLKDNIFGLEVDSGKQDIVTGKIGVNLAWSGDAVYSMDQAEDEKQVGSNIQTLTYSVPETGSNIWFDAWAMPNTERTEDQRALAHEFLNFLCNPFYAAKNMDYTGYTSFIAGDDILDLVRDWYDCRTDEMYVTYEDVDCDIYVTNNPQYDDDLLLYDDFISTKHGLRHEDREDEESPLVPTISDDQPLYFFYDENENEEIDAGEMLPVEDDEGNPVLFGGITIVDEEAFDYTNIPADFDYDDEELCYEYIQEVDLSYFFKRDNASPDDYGEEDMVFYGRGNYLPYCYQDEQEVWHHNTSVGRQFFVQFPDEETMTRCAIMKDYGPNNQYVMKMWEDFRSNSLPTWALVLFILEILLFTAGIAWWIYIKNIKKKLRQKRKEAAEVK